MAAATQNTKAGERPGLCAQLGAHTWRLSCARGEEAALISALIDLARRDDAPLSWIDAAALVCRLDRARRTHPTTEGTRSAEPQRGDSTRPSAACTRSTTTP